MREKLNARCNLFAENCARFRKAFPLESSCFYHVCGAIFTNNDMTADVDQLKNTSALLKKHVNAFSNFRASATLSIITMLALDNAPDDRMTEAIEVYKCLKQHFFASEYLSVASMILSSVLQKEKYDEFAERTRRLYDMMKKHHPLITSSDDSVFFAMLTLSERTDEEIIDETVACYDILKNSFFDKNSVLSLALVLALSESKDKTPEEKCNDTVQLFNILKEKKNKYGTGYELATLGILAMRPCDLNQTADELIEVADLLKQQKGYGFFGLDRAQRLMHAGMLLVGENDDDGSVATGAVIGSSLSLIAAQHAALCAAIAAGILASNAIRSK